MQRPPSEETVQTPWHALDGGEALERLQSGPHGLTRAEAESRLLEHGPNQLEEAPPTPPLVLILRQFRSPLIYILLIATVVTLAVGEYVDAGVIALVLGLNALIGFVQEHRAEKSVRALMGLAAPRARVVREGKEWDIESRRLVPGDVVVLESGARVPADLRLLSSVALAIDESLLTGESVPAAKQAAPLEPEQLLPDRSNMAYTGAVVTSGRGRGLVVATGARTELGAIAGRIRQEEVTVTPLQQRMGRFARLVSIVVGLAALAGFVLGVGLGNPPAEMFMLGVAVAVAAIPEGLPVVLTITLAVGVRRMAQRNAIMRRLPAVETLGSTSVIGSDKTGTLTQNRMTVEEVWSAGRTYAITPEEPADRALRQTLLCGVLTNEAEVYSTDEGLEMRGDPTESALLVAAGRFGVDYEEEREAHPMFADIPFEPERQYSASVRARGGAYSVFAKGAPERILEMSTSMLSDEGERALSRGEIHEAARAMAARGLRVLAMAYREHPEAPHGPEDVKEPKGLVFAGLVGMLDPPRPGVKEAVAGCQQAGIRVVMITGDHAATAQAIGQSLAIATADAPVLTGVDLSQIEDDELRRRVKDVSIFARVSPEQKLRIVHALRERGEVVAVTGDGVNDAPALKAADVGVAMGRSGTDVAREASDMVLVDDNFVSIYAAVEEGRITFDNLRKATFFLISTGAATVLTILAALTAGLPAPFVPAQLLWLNLVTNGLQDIALAFEPGDPGIIRRPPRSRKEGVVSRLLWERTVLAGLVMAAGALFLFRWELLESGSLVRAQTVALTTMVIFQVFHVGNSRSETLSVFAKSPLSNPFLFLTTAAAVLVHLSALNLAPTQFVLRVEPVLEPMTWLRMVGVAATILLAMELHKLLRRRFPLSRS